MSKESALRAMREAKYAERQARAAGGTTAPARARVRPPVAPPPAATGTSKSGPAEVTEAATDELCGHKSMNGRTCTREKGHSAKNHRYS